MEKNIKDCNRIYHISELNFSDIPMVSKKYPKEVNGKIAHDWINELVPGIIKINHIDDSFAIRMYKEFRDKLEIKIEKLIEDETGEKKISIGSKVIMKNEEDNGILTITRVVRFKDDILNQGWYMYQLDNGACLYRKEFNVIE